MKGDSTKQTGKEELETWKAVENTGKEGDDALTLSVQIFLY